MESFHTKDAITDITPTNNPITLKKCTFFTFYVHLTVPTQNQLKPVRSSPIFGKNYTIKYLLSYKRLKYHAKTQL